MQRLLWLLVPLSLLGCASAAKSAPPPRAPTVGLSLPAAAPPAAERDAVAMVSARLGPPGGADGAGQRHVAR